MGAIEAGSLFDALPATQGFKVIKAGSLADLLNEEVVY